MYIYPTLQYYTSPLFPAAKLRYHDQQAAATASLWGAAGGLRGHLDASGSLMGGALVACHDMA